jgi:hypothetical protein
MRLAVILTAWADGLLYLHGENGEVALVEASAEAYRERGRFTPPNGPEHANAMEKAWVYPVIADGRLYIRDLDRLWCYDIRAPKQEPARADSSANVVQYQRWRLDRRNPKTRTPTPLHERVAPTR